MSEQLKPKHYKDLLVWQKGMVLAKLVYRLSVRFPMEEKFGLISQIRRASVSIPPNIAEGQARQGTKEFLQFLSHADGSLAELETQVLLSVELGFVCEEDVKEILEKIDELQRMLAGLKRKLAAISAFTRSSSLSSRAEHR